MGLDMYAWVVDQDRVISDEQFHAEKDERLNEIHYWRKHYDLHEWMHRLYERRGGKKLGHEFNCVPVRLYEQDLNVLEEDIVEDALPFGDSSPGYDNSKNDLEFVQKARDALKEGKAVYYDSWW